VVAHHAQAALSHTLPFPCESLNKYPAFVRVALGRTVSRSVGYILWDPPSLRSWEERKERKKDKMCILSLTTSNLLGDARILLLPRRRVEIFSGLPTLFRQASVVNK
jgi:hypothetical protein